MPNLSRLDLSAEKIISFLRQDLRLQEIYQEILRRQIVQDAAQARAIAVIPDEIQVEIDRLRNAKRLENPSDWMTWLDEQMITIQDLEANIRIHLEVEKLAHMLFIPEVQDYFTQHPADFEQILLYRIAVPYERLAQELFYRIEESEISFYEAAHLYDVDEQRRLHCGYEGKQYRRDLKPEIAHLIANRPVSAGSILGPIRYSQSTYDLFLIEECTPAELSSTVLAELLSEKLQAWLDQEMTVYLG
jgi:hypothetical protein